MNILIDLRPLMHAKVSGVTVYISNLLKELKLHDAKNSYYFYYNSFQDIEIDKASFKGLKLIRTKYPNKLFNLMLSFLRWPKIDKLAAKKIGKPIDVCFFPDPRPAAVSSKVKKVMTFHDLSFYRYPKNFSLTTRIWHKILRPKFEALNCHKIIAVSAFTKKELEEIYGVPAEKIKVIYHGILRKFRQIENEDLFKRIREKYQLPQRFILSLSTVEPRKNLQSLIKAVSMLNERHQDTPYSLVIVGRKNSRIFRDPHLEIEDFVRFLGFVKLEDKVALYNLAAAYASVSFYEGFGFPILEAMKCGCPVVASNIAVYQEIAGDYAHFADPFDINAIANALEYAVLRGREDDMVKKGLEHARSYSWRDCSQRTIAIFHELHNLSQKSK